MPYQGAPPHASAGGYDDFDLGASSAYAGYPHAPPPRRTHSSAGYRDPPYRDPPPYAPPRGREYDMYDDLGVKARGGDPYGRSAPASSQPRRGGLEDDLFANPFGALGGGQDMFDLGLGGGGKSAPQQGMSDPFALFQGFVNGGAGGVGRGGGGGGMSMSPTGGADDAFARMFDQLSTSGGGGNGHGSPGGATRGAFATHRVTRKHTNRDGDVTVSRQERTMAMMDAGPRGQVLVESSFRMVGRQPSGGGSIGGGGGMRSGSPASMFDAPALPAHSAPPRHRASTLGYGGLDRGAIASASHTAYSGIEPRYSGLSALPAIESGRAPPRQLTAPPGMDLALYGGGGPVSRW